MKWFGGFQGDETTLSQRDYELYPTILSGDIGVQGDSTDNSYHVIYSIDADSTTAIDGFQITSGNADFGVINNDFSFGGGLFITGGITSSSLKINNCHFCRNFALFGGGINCSTLHPIITNCLFTENRAEFSGGGIWKAGAAVDITTPFISHCIFEGNTGRGGGVFLDNVSGYHEIVDSDFYVNRTPDGGDYGGAIAFDGGSTNQNSNFDISGCYFEEGKSSYGASIYFGAFFNLSEVTFNFKVEDCEFLNNQSGRGIVAVVNVGNCFVNLDIKESDFFQNCKDEPGSTIHIEKSTNAVCDINIDKCIFLENGFQGVQGSVFSTIHSQSDSLQISNSIFGKNHRGILYSEGDAQIINSTIFRNGNSIIRKDWDKEILINNSIFWEDLPLEKIFDNGPTITDTTLVMLGFNINHTILKNENCLFNGTDYCGDGMLYNTYPEFRDTLNNDFSLRSCSPAINQGDDLSIDTLDIFFDFVGNPRILDSAVDLGAYETQDFEVLVPQSQNVKCHAGSDGAITWVQHGTAPFTFEWDNGQTTGTTFTGLTAGNYSIAVMDADQCLDTFNMMVNQPLPLEMVEAITSATGAMNADGAVEITTTGGIPDYDYLWSTGDTTAMIENLLPGVYTVTVTDANDCAEVLTLEVDFMTATKNIDQKEVIQLIPNLMEQGTPAKLVLDLATASHLEVAIYNELGQRLFVEKIVGIQGKSEYDLPLFHSTGLFFVKITDEQGRHQIMKWIIQ